MTVGVGFIAGQLGLGGAEQQLYYLLAGMDRSRFRPVVISLGPTPHEYWEERIVRLNIPVSHVPRKLGRTVRAVRIAGILRAENVRIAHAWVFHANPYSALAGRLSSVPVRLGSMQESYAGLPNNKFLRWIGYRGLDVLITNSRATAGEIEQYALTTTQVQVVPNGVDVPAPLSPIERRHLKCELGYSESDLVIGSIGRLDGNKNYSMLLRVFATLHKKWEMLRLLIIGEGPVKSQLLDLAKQLGIASKVRFPGAIPLAARYLPAMEICCLTSYTEGVPNVVMEAASAGLPVISTRCGDTAYLIEEHISGYLVSPDDDVTMSKYLDQLLSNPERRFRMGQAGQEKMRREFSIGSMVQRMTLVYEELLAEKRLSVA